MTASSALLIRSPLLPGESLPSLLQRLGRLNAYEPTSLVRVLCGPQLRDRHFVRPARGELLTRLAALTRLEPLALHAATAHHFAGLLTPPETPVGHLTIGTLTAPELVQGLAVKHLRPETAAQFCPHCLAQSPYHRWLWLPVAVSACVEHRCLLLDRCPGCQQPVSVRAVVEGRCRQCATSLAEGQPERLADDALLTQRLLQGWLTAAETPDAVSVPAHPPRVLYRVVEGLRFSLMSHPAAWPHFPRLREMYPLAKGQKLSPAESFALYSPAVAALFDWPHRFNQFLARFARPAAPPSLFGQFRFLYSQWLQYRWQRPEFQFVQTAFDAFVSEQYPAALLPAKRYQGDPALAARLPVLALQAVAEQLGLSKRVVVELVRAGLLVAESGPDPAGPRPWWLNRPSVDRFLGRLRANTVAGPRPQFSVDLPTAARMAVAVGLNAAGLLQLVTTGQLRALWPEGQPVSRLRFAEAELRTGLAEVKQAHGWVGREEIARRMGVKLTVVSKWVAAGLLRPVATSANSQHFDRTEVEAFVNDHVFSAEAARILAVGREVVQRWARHGRLTPVAGGADDPCHRYLFRRAEVERLRPEQRLTGPQLARQLGLSRSQLGQWIKAGKVTPISGPGIDGSRHYLFVKECALAD